MTRLDPPPHRTSTRGWTEGTQSRRDGFGQFGFSHGEENTCIGLHLCAVGQLEWQFEVSDGVELHGLFLSAAQGYISKGKLKRLVLTLINELIEHKVHNKCTTLNQTNSGY